MKEIGKSCRKGEGIYCFGKTECKVIKELKLPVKIGGRIIWIKVKMLEGDVPLLIGRETMEEWKMKIDFDKQKASINEGKEVININYRVNEGGNIILNLFYTERKGWLGDIR